MKRFIGLVVVLVVALFTTTGAVSRCYIHGYVLCDAVNQGQIDIPGDTGVAGVAVVLRDVGGTEILNYAITDASGYFSLYAPNPRTYVVSIEASTLPSGSTDVSGSQTIAVDENGLEVNFLTANPACVVTGCWMTGGGAKFEPLVNGYVADYGPGPKHSFGGNVYPGCSSTAGDGGSWNDIAHASKLHFQAQAIKIVRCGNVDGIPPGSTSPVTPYNFIEFRGTGRLMGIKGNKANYPLVYFFARVEDHNEPGSSGASAGSLIDRYFLNVYSNQADPVGSSLLLVSENMLDASDVKPVLITHGNLQLHISSCSVPPQ